MYRTIFHSKRRRLVLKSGVIIYIQNDIYKNYSNIFKYIFTYIFIFFIKFEHNMNILNKDVDQKKKNYLVQCIFWWRFSTFTQKVSWRRRGHQSSAEELHLEVLMIRPTEGEWLKDFWKIFEVKYMKPYRCSGVYTTMPRRSAMFFSKNI